MFIIFSKRLARENKDIIIPTNIKISVGYCADELTKFKIIYLHELKRNEIVIKINKRVIKRPNINKIISVLVIRVKQSKTVP